MNAERDRIAQRCAEVAGIETLVVQTVAAFMDTAEEAGGEFVFIYTRRDPHICGMK